MKQKLTEAEKQLLMDKLFITEIMNDLARRGDLGSGEYSKACTMLKDWGSELRIKCRGIFPASRLHRVFNEVVGRECW